MELQVSLNSGRPEQYNAERLVNLYAEQGTGKARVRLTGTPGLTEFTDTGPLPVRGMCMHDRLLYVVSNGLYRVTANGAATRIGSIPGTSRVFMASNGLQLSIVSEGSIYVLANGSLTKVSDEDAPAATTVDYLDGYFLFSDGSGSFYLSDLYSGTSYDALDFASAESNPDPIVRLFVDHREVFLMGSETIEIWTNTGGADFPFERVPGAIVELGICGRNAVAKLDNSIVWIDHKGIVRRMAGGYAPQRISTHEVERALSGKPLHDAEAWAYSSEGHEFFIITVPGAGTWVFDAATSLWHERQTYGTDRWRASCHARGFGYDLVGDIGGGKVYRMDSSVFTDAGEPMLAEVIFPPVHNESNRFRVSRVVLDMEHGETAPHGDSVVRLDLSDDSQNWDTVGYSSMGSTGNRVTRTVWRRLGQHRTLHMRFRISDPVRRTIYGAYAEITGDA